MYIHKHIYIIIYRDTDLYETPAKTNADEMSQTDLI